MISRRIDLRPELNDPFDASEFKKSRIKTSCKTINKEEDIEEQESTAQNTLLWIGLCLSLNKHPLNIYVRMYKRRERQRNRGKMRFL